mmetsp:Transcript_85723/g.149652  ORF Transcript_85723/g.149652 Transcript_85723/m.149652 type:complete len:124 (+) Transcript_85723:1081-1452(+)
MAHRLFRIALLFRVTFVAGQHFSLNFVVVKGTLPSPFDGLLTLHPSTRPLQPPPSLFTCGAAVGACLPMWPVEQQTARDVALWARTSEPVNQTISYLMAKTQPNMFGTISLLLAHKATAQRPS